VQYIFPKPFQIEAGSSLVGGHWQGLSCQLGGDREPPPSPPAKYRAVCVVEQNFAGPVATKNRLPTLIDVAGRLNKQTVQVGDGCLIK
jgi:hypothetical protein